MSIISYKCPHCGVALVYNAMQKRFLCDYCLSSFTNDEMNEILSKEKNNEEVTISTEESIEEIQKQIDDYKKDIGMAISDNDNVLNNKEEVIEKEMEEETIFPPFAISKNNNDNLINKENNNDEDKEIEKNKTIKNYLDFKIYRCPSCGAEIITEKNTAATICYYCQNPIVVTQKVAGEYLPDYILPFEIDKTKAKDLFLKWIKGKKYVPNDFYDDQHINKLTGVYFPYFLYSCDVDGQMEANGQKIRIWRTGNTRFTEYKDFKITRAGSLKINKMTRNAIKKGNKEIVEGVLPYNINKLETFNAGFLSGFFAQKRDIEYKTYESEAKTEAEDVFINKLKLRASEYKNLKINKKEVSINNEKWEYALLPVWVMTYKDDKTNDIYYFAMNGQSGKIYGKLPVSKKKLGLLFGIIYLISSVLLLIGGYFI